jgi:hypothetical protein
MVEFDAFGDGGGVDGCIEGMMAWWVWLIDGPEFVALSCALDANFSVEVNVEFGGGEGGSAASIT